MCKRSLYSCGLHLRDRYHPLEGDILLACNHNSVIFPLWGPFFSLYQKEWYSSLSWAHFAVILSEPWTEMALGLCSGQRVCPYCLGNRLPVQDTVIFSTGRRQMERFLEIYVWIYEWWLVIFKTQVINSKRLHMFIVHRYFWVLLWTEVCPPNSCVEALTLSMTVCGDKT